MNPRRYLEVALLAAGIATAAGAVYADAIYKYVDDKGNVTYSSTPPKGRKAEKLDAPGAPTAEEVAAARKQLEVDKQQVRKYEENRRKQEAEAAKLRQEQLAREQELAASQSAQAAGEAPIYYPIWGYRPPIKPIRPWPKPEQPISPYTPTPSNPQMAKPVPRE
ncbi:MAG: DUF4124 domain-containing protein [Burkholderiales bacterium]